MGASVIRDGPLMVIDYLCAAGPDDQPYPEIHTRCSLSYVRRGSFGCRTLGCDHQLLAGGFLVGRPGDEFVCTHEHHRGGDECLSIQLAPEVFSELADRPDLWRIGAIAPMAELAAFGELTQAAASGRVDFGLTESALTLVGRFLSVTTQRETPTRVNAQVRHTICRAADWIDANSEQDISLLDAAREARFSPYHFLRTFCAVLGLTPHQHLVRCRLRKAARRLLQEDTAVTEIAFEVGFGDLSNFVRGFKRAAGVAPGRFGRLKSADRKNLQVLHRRLG